MKNSLFGLAKKQAEPLLSNSPDVSLRPWKILLVDDEQDVITVSKMALKDLSFEGAPVQIITASSAQEAQLALTEHNDIALSLVDVVMETDHAGLDLVKWIRETKENSLIRLILRTGQPGQAPEEDVIRKYEINDYKHKTDLTAIRLRTTVLSALRSYRDLSSISNNQKKVEQMLVSCGVVLRNSTVESFLQAARQELSTFLKQANLELHLHYHTCIPYAEKMVNQYVVTKDSIYHITPFEDDVEVAVSFQIDEQKIEAKQTFIEQSDAHYTHKVLTDEYSDIIVHLNLNLTSPLKENAFRLMPLFTTNLALALDKLFAKKEVDNVQEELMLMLSEAIEERSKETGAHVRRVAHICEYIGQLLQLPEKHVHMIKHSAPMHDLGKIGVPESILHKPGKLTDEEWDIMRSHPVIGYKLLHRSKHGLPRMGAMVSIAHHEKWDGSGYPNGTKGEDIPLEGRIMAIADVIDALGSNRSYKTAWTNSEISAFLEEQKGNHFDPQLCDVVIQNFDEIMKIREKFPDDEE